MEDASAEELRKATAELNIAVMDQFSTKELREAIAELETPLMPDKMPPMPPKTLQMADYQGNGVGATSANSEWSETGRPAVLPAPDDLQRRVKLEWLRYTSSNHIDPRMFIGDETAENMQEWRNRRKNIYRGIGRCNRSFAGPDSFLAQTITAEVLIHGVKTRAYNYYHRGQQLSNNFSYETPEEKKARLLSAKAHTLKAQELLGSLREVARSQVEVARSQNQAVERRGTAVSSRTRSCAPLLRKVDREVEWFRQYDVPYMDILRDQYASSTKEFKPYLPRWTPSERQKFWEEVFSTNDRIFACYLFFEKANHFEDNMKSDSPVRELFMGRLMVACEAIYENVVSPKLRNWRIRSLSDSVVRTFVKVIPNWRRVYIAIEDHSRSEEYSEKNLGGIGIIKVMPMEQLHVQQGESHGENGQIAVEPMDIDRESGQS